ncbi:MULTISPECIES: undecaprenyl-diphosphate phosphatase [Aestuariimicrobium]|uniref:undecaprenyl-diphosphate phosphatase n=1 Tax=Aestuariimicrobium TaxID=396388 RepID=UPI0003B7B21E|nr:MULTISPECIES: undecaprenyl-diphosphate phosphatase [Aestuariimicrobium]CAI9399819.1 Undecaprenyl-diphosphatase [Aestuariimicrobium sp. T2.26MG-19.2B]
MNWLHAILLGIVEGITEFLPVSSTGHLNVVEKLLGYQIDSVGMTAFTAIIQVGAIIAAVAYFWRDIVAIAAAWGKGLANAEARRDPNYRLGWGVILGSIPVAVVGLLFQGAIETTMRNLWVIIAALALWSVVMWVADRYAARREPQSLRGMSDVTIVDAIVIGLFQALSPVFPGISRSGATISAGLFRGFDRVTATRLSFFLGIPALVAAGGLQATENYHQVATTVGWGNTVIATVISFVVAYASIAWLLRYVSKNSFTAFIIYRVVLAAVLAVLVIAKVVTA